MTRELKLLSVVILSSIIVVSLVVGSPVLSRILFGNSSGLPFLVAIVAWPLLLFSMFLDIYLFASFFPE